MSRCFTILKSVKQLKNCKKLLNISDLTEENPETGEIMNKNINNELSINHYIILFFMDLFQGI